VSTHWRVRLAILLLISGVIPAAGRSQCSDDFNDCTVNDVCDANGTCRGTAVPDGTPCRTSVFVCLVRPTCLNGECVGGEQAPDGTPCHTTNSLCYTEGRCRIGVCEGSDPITCPDDGDPCTSEFCSPISERCESFPQCPDFACSTGHCDPATGQCTYTPIKEGEACDDFDSCTIGEHCVAGDCVGTLVDTPTATATSPVTATPTARPSATPTLPRPCSGDCDGDGEVTITDIVVMVNVARGAQPASACAGAAAGSNGEFAVNDILQAVNEALTGCGGS
jgi:hypothetical protein